MMTSQEVGNFSSIKWVTFQLSRFRPKRPSGSFFNYQMGNFSIDKNKGRDTGGGDSPDDRMVAAGSDLGPDHDPARPKSASRSIYHGGGGIRSLE